MSFGLQAWPSHQFFELRSFFFLISKNATPSRVIIATLVSFIISFLALLFPFRIKQDTQKNEGVKKSHSLQKTNLQMVLHLMSTKPTSDLPCSQRRKVRKQRVDSRRVLPKTADASEPEQCRSSKGCGIGKWIQSV